ncbi:MAG TPA: SDR family oxidoreductase [Xanthomonadaceae bacterium]|nr:SDR family oxidoreductase [Xanthomonadaceae bacterium]
MNKAVLVVGASGGVGRGLSEALLDAGYAVIAVGRDPGRLDALARDLGRPDALTLLPASVATDSEAAALSAAVRRMRQSLAAIVVSVTGPFERGRLLEQPADFLERKLAEDLLPQWHAARHLLPLLAEGARGAPYVVIGGPCVETPWAGYGHLSISGAAQRLLIRALRLETEDLPVRVQQLAMCSPVRTGRNESCACPEWPSALDVGHRLVSLIEQPATEAVIAYDA